MTPYIIGALTIFFILYYKPEMARVLGSIFSILKEIPHLIFEIKALSLASLISIMEWHCSLIFGMALVTNYFYTLVWDLS